jgi:hypothetical protein
MTIRLKIEPIKFIVLIILATAFLLLLFGCIKNREIEKLDEKYVAAQSSINNERALTVLREIVETQKKKMQRDYLIFSLIFCISVMLSAYSYMREPYKKKGEESAWLSVSFL